MAAPNKKSTDAPAQGNGFQSLPFEAKGKKKVAPRLKAKPTQKGEGSGSSDNLSKSALKNSAQAKTTQAKTAQGKTVQGKTARRSSGIPEQVSQRMIRRMAIFCGVPTLLGLASFPVSYFVLQQGIELPNVAVLLVSLGFLGLGVLGLSYGVLSASWDEDAVGTVLGWPEFQLNLGRTLESWKEARDRNRL
ncbi:MAG: PAM68 family protein [Thermosynechococcaceae cyanobacterium MS004]|nr:PAM68 family protein [Thermosynechococcaceae cyanobacterium MS004]